jgi:amidase
MREGFGGAASEAVVDEKVRAAAVRLGKLGASVSDVSVPLHLNAGGITFGALQAMLTSMFHLDGCLLERPDIVPPSYSEHQSRWRLQADQLPANVKSGLITCEILRRRSGYTTVSQAMQRLPVLRAAYDAALAEVDMLLLPTTPMRASLLPPADAAPDVVTALAFAPLANTAPFNSTHHPAISIPCGMSEGLPVGMMLVGAHFSEAVLYRAAHAFEQHDDWHAL